MIQRLLYFIKSKEPVASAAVGAGLVAGAVALSQGEPLAAVGLAVLSAAWGFFARHFAWSPDSVDKL